MQKNNTSYDHTIFMQRCLELATNGLGWVAPNPMVGAVIVREGKIIGEGFHRRFGEAHAEVNAIRSVKDSKLLESSTLYVNLEPCAHSGKTPPCADLIIQKRIPRVIIGTSDPNSLVAGKGIQKLEGAGIEVISNILSDECYGLNRRFFTFHEKKRPYIILKWAKTKDGFIDKVRSSESPAGVNWITSDYARALVHKWRAEEQGILVGTETVLLDNPKLTLREWSGNHPVRIILDRHLRIPGSASIWDGKVKTLLYNTLEERVIGNMELVRLNFKDDSLLPVMEDLYHRGISSVLVEGGRRILENLLAERLWDEARIFTGNKNFEKGIRSPEIRNGEKYLEMNYFNDTISCYYPK